MERKPNFLLIITDQHRADHVACYGNPIVRTPNIDMLAARGFASDSFYVCSPICMPNRASLMTGRMPMVHGVRHNGIPLALNSVCFTDLLRAAGWRTVMVGKSHLQTMTGQPPAAKRPTWDGLELPPPALAEALRDRVASDRYDQESGIKWRDDPDHDVELPYYGFDEVALANEHGDQVEGHYTRWLRAKRADGDSLRGAKNATPDESVIVPQGWRTRLPEELYPTTYVAETTKEYLEKFAADRSRPFFLKCSFPDPHHPFTPPGRYFDMYDPGSIPLPASWDPGNAPLPPHVAWSWAQRDAGKAVKHTPLPFACTAAEARQAIALTYGMITMIDDAIGGILAKLAALGLADDTVVIFTADHGDFMGDHQLLLKGPMHYQGILRVPFIWVDPERPAQGRRSAALAQTHDIPATVLIRAGLAPFNGMQGQSLLPLIAGDESSGRSEILIEEEGQRLCLGFAERVRMRSLFTGRWRISVYDQVEWGELYDLAEDPNELRNLWDDAGAQRLKTDLLAALARSMVRNTDTSPFPIAVA